MATEITKIIKKINKLKKIIETDVTKQNASHLNRFREVPDFFFSLTCKKVDFITVDGGCQEDQIKKSWRQKIANLLATFSQD